MKFKLYPNQISYVKIYKISDYVASCGLSRFGAGHSILVFQARVDERDRQNP